MSCHRTGDEWQIQVSFAPVIIQLFVHSTKQVLCYSRKGFLHFSFFPVKCNECDMNHWVLSLNM